MSKLGKNGCIASWLKWQNGKNTQRGGQKGPANEEQVTIDFAFASVCSIQKIEKGLGKREWFMLNTQNKNTRFCLNQNLKKIKWTENFISCVPYRLKIRIFWKYYSIVL